MMPALMRKWFGPGRTRHDHRDGDPYLETLLLQLVRLRGGDRRRSIQRQA